MRHTLLLLAVLLYGCGQPTITPLQREYELALRRVESRNLPDRRRVSSLLTAFDAVQAADYGRARRLDTLVDPVKWPDLYILYGAMEARLSKIETYLPVGARSNYRGGYGLKELRSRKQTARLESGAYYLALARADVRVARQGNKYAARTAYHHLQRVLFYLPERYGELSAVSDEMLDRGTVRILLLLSGDRNLRYMAEYLSRDLWPVREDWYAVDFQDTGQAVDYEAELQLTDYSSWGPTESTSRTTYDKEVLDYVEKQEYEERINDSTVVKKVREIEHFRTITASVTAVVQEYRLTAYGELTVFDPVAGRRTQLQVLNGSAEWTNEYTTCSGNREALPAFACSGSSSYPPATGVLLDKAVTKLLDATLYDLRRRYGP